MTKSVSDKPKQAGETYRNFEQWERDELLENLIRDLAVCNIDIQETMIALAEEAYGHLLKEGLQKARNDSSTS
ncbi:catalase-related domain-containing protein [Lysinibacillus sp. fls2-241-R2A-57]|uniref:catalase-related domain-containing protein n=1 Tax=Lysinibacillus sp. fls2-241-R2A-57 TaxID=3040292 RepID=UPI002553764E|nr:catalase-related domain-containing protein [Lysinibacillus sp. fls2-241-R2A-57]